MYTKISMDRPLKIGVAISKFKDFLLPDPKNFMESGSGPDSSRSLMKNSFIVGVVLISLTGEEEWIPLGPMLAD